MDTAELFGKLDSGEGLKLDIRITIRDEQGAADEAAEDLMAMLDTYVDDYNQSGCGDNYTKGDTEPADTSFEDMVAQLRANIARSRV